MYTRQDRIPTIFPYFIIIGILLMGGNIMSRPITKEQFEKDLFNIHGDKIKLNGEYKNISTKAEFICECGYIWSTRPYSLTKNKTGCAKCSNNIRLTFDYIKEYIESYEYELISTEYINAHKKLKLKCPEGHLFESNFNRFKSGKRCGVCANNKRKNIEEIRDFIKSIGYELLSDTYTNNATPLEIRCSEGHEIKMTYASLKGGNICSVCAGNAKKNISDITKFAEDNNLKLLSNKYINSHSYLLFKCPENHIFKMTWAKIQQGQRCPVCKESKGERKIYEFFQKYNIKSERQYFYNNLTSDLGNPLKFDFAVLDDNNNVKFLVEYDGIFHYEKQYNDDGFERTQYHDSLKNEYCAKNNIPLLRIPYWDFDNIENILQKYLTLEIAS